MAGVEMASMTASQRYIVTLYFAVVTMTTTGYGDITGHYYLDFFAIICVIICGMIVFAYALSVFAATIATRDAPKYAQQLGALLSGGGPGIHTPPVRGLPPLAPPSGANIHSKAVLPVDVPSPWHQDSSRHYRG